MSFVKRFAHAWVRLRVDLNGIFVVDAKSLFIFHCVSILNGYKWIKEFWTGRLKSGERFIFLYNLP